MPKINVKPSARSAYCAPRLTPIRPAETNSFICLSGIPVGCCLFAGCGGLLDDGLHLAVDDGADAEREGEFLVDAEELLTDPQTIAKIGIFHGKAAHRLRDLLGIGDRAGLGDRLGDHPRRAYPLEEQVAFRPLRVERLL